MTEPIIITLLFLSTLGNIETTSFEIHMSCGSWFKLNVAVNERKKTFFSNRYYYMYEGKKVISYVCSDKVPR